MSVRPEVDRDSAVNEESVLTLLTAPCARESMPPPRRAARRWCSSRREHGPHLELLRQAAWKIPGSRRRELVAQFRPPSGVSAALDFT